MPRLLQAVSSEPAAVHTESGPRILIGLDSISKRFGNLNALDNVSFDIVPATLHGVVGENGAGKSTLMKILGGSLRPDGGRILLNGTAAMFNSPAQALRAGIGMVYQNFSLLPNLTVLENIMLGDSRVPFWIRRQRAAAQVEQATERFGFRFDLAAPVWRLGMAEKQKLEIFKLLWRDAQVLILDEPTSQLAPFEAEDVLETLIGLARGGRTVLLVSHHLQEVLQCCTRISVLRRGRLIATVGARETRISELGALMVGELPCPPERTGKRRASTTPLLSLRDVHVRPSMGRRGLRQITLDLFPGEMVGIAGVVGSGQDELAAIVAGQLQPSRGSLALNGRECSWKDLCQADSPVAHVPADPRNEATIGELSLTDNLFLREAVRSNGKLGVFLSRSAMRQQAQQWLAKLDVRPADPQLACGALSGGNMQRLVLTREIAAPFKLLLAVNPTAGLNIAAACDVRNVLRDLTTAGSDTDGRTVLLISTDLSELLMCDRIVVLHAGEIVGIEEARELNAEVLGLLMGGVKADLVRALKRDQKDGSMQGWAELQTALHQMLESPDWWQRRVAIQAGFRVFDGADLEKLAHRLGRETHPAVRAWLLLTLARLHPERNLHELWAAFESGDQGAPCPVVTELLGAQLYLLGAEDLPTLRKMLADRFASELPAWELILGYGLLRHLEASEAERYRVASRARLERFQRQGT